MAFCPRQTNLLVPPCVTPKTKLSVTPFAYAVSPGDQIWLNYVNLFVETIKRNGKLLEAAKAAHLESIVAP